jgi:hypothetical protein
MDLVVVLELTTTTRAGPKGLGGRAFQLPCPHVFRLQLLQLFWLFHVRTLAIQRFEQFLNLLFHGANGSDSRFFMPSAD